LEQHRWLGCPEAALYGLGNRVLEVKYLFSLIEVCQSESRLGVKVSPSLLVSFFSDQWSLLLV